MNSLGPCCVWFGGLKRIARQALVGVLFAGAAASFTRASNLRHVPLSLSAQDVIATGNEWISMPTIRASDGALMNFNVLSMRRRGLLQVEGGRGSPVLRPYLTLDNRDIPLRDLKWELLEYWIPVAHMSANGADLTVTYCAPPGSRGAFIRLTLTNHGARQLQVGLGMKASWGGLSRVTYTPVSLNGKRRVADAPWVSPAEVFSFSTEDTDFAWSLLHPHSRATQLSPPLSDVPAVDALRSAMVEPGQSVEADFIVGVGVEEFSAAHNAKALGEIIDRSGSEAIVQQSGEWCRARTRTTGKPQLDVLMNRNLLFTLFYAWGKTLDTEQLVGVTSRSPRYYVSAAYWDRDAMLWSFPALLDIDTSMAREALGYAFTIQLRNTGIHSRFIDGTVLEDGLQLDELVAPVIAAATYVQRTKDQAFLTAHRRDLLFLRDRLLTRFDPGTGLYSTLQDSQDNFQKLPFSTYDNVLTWRALLDFSDLFGRLGDQKDSQSAKGRANSLRGAILKYCVSPDAPNAGGPMFVTATDGKKAIFTEIPPGSLLKLPILGFVAQDDPVFVRTERWFHSSNFKYSFVDLPYGLPGSFRLPFTSSWSVADHLRLAAYNQQALKILLGSAWDGGIISEGISPETGAMDPMGGAFATAAGYVSDAICQMYCLSDRHPTVQDGPGESRRLETDSSNELRQRNSNLNPH